jgi:phosphoribosylglycinamide formyltransferase-1
MVKIKAVVLASGKGSDFQSIIDGIESGSVNAQVTLLITDNPTAFALERAKKHGIPSVVFGPDKYSKREDLDKAIKSALDKEKPDLVVLAGYMRIIKDKELLRAYAGRMINIHPSLLPAFPGAHAQEDAFKAGEKVSGFTIHFVDDTLDGGPIIYQEAVDISGCKTADEVKAKILAREHVGLPMIVDSFSRGRYRIEGKRAVFEKS